jgi:hypothetical protein
VSVSVTIVTVSVVIMVRFIRLMMAYCASDSCPRNAVMARLMAYNSADHCSFDASSSKGQRRGRSSQNEHSAENQNRFQDASPS